MTNPALLKTADAESVSDGAGVQIRRGIGTAQLRNLDPFLMLDHFGSDDPDEYIAGFPAHPHRGFITLTYMIDGHMRHEDSMQNAGHLKAGGVQWMKAGSGVIHSEMPQQESGLMRGFQLWINLPAAQKMSDPAYQEFPADRVPVCDLTGATVKIIAGRYQNHGGPVVDPSTDLSFFDITLCDGGFEVDPTLAATAFIYVFEGSVSVTTSSESLNIASHRVCVLPDPGASTGRIMLRAASPEARCVLIAGQAIGEPIAQHGPFVMNTLSEIKQAISDYQQGTLVKQQS